MEMNQAQFLVHNDAALAQFGVDFLSYMVNFEGVGFSGGFIPSISGANGVWYLKRSCSLCVDFEVLSSDLVGRVVLTAATTLAISFARKVHVEGGSARWYPSSSRCHSLAVTLALGLIIVR